MRQVTVATVQPDWAMHVFERPDAGEYTENELLEIVGRNVDYVCGLLDRVGAVKPDIVCAPEGANGIGNTHCFYAGHADKFRVIAEKGARTLVEKAGRVARAHGMYVIVGSFEPHNGRVYNSAILIGRDGAVEGRYFKTHLSAAEVALVSPGDDLTVFDTDFGKIGILICYDMNFPETARVLALKGAEIVFNPTQGFEFGTETIGEMRVKMRAFDNGLYVVTSQAADARRCSPGRSCIVHLDGHILADAGYEPDTFVWADIDMERSDFEILDRPPGFPNMRKRMARQRRPELYGAMVDPHSG